MDVIYPVGQCLGVAGRVVKLFAFVWLEEATE